MTPASRRCARASRVARRRCLEQLGSLGIDSNAALLTKSVFWLEGVKDDKLISVNTFCTAVAMQDMLRRAYGGEWAESLRDIDLLDAAGLTTQKKKSSNL